MFFFLRYKAGIESPHVLEVKMKFATQLRIVLLAFFLCLGNLSQTKCLITRKIHFVHVWDEAALVQCHRRGENTKQKLLVTELAQHVCYFSQYANFAVSIQDYKQMFNVPVLPVLSVSSE